MYLIVEAIVRSLSWRKHFIHNDNWYIITVYAVNILSFNVFFFFSLISNVCRSYTPGPIVHVIP